MTSLESFESEIPEQVEVRVDLINLVIRSVQRKLLKTLSIGSKRFNDRSNIVQLEKLTVKVEFRVILKYALLLYHWWFAYLCLDAQYLLGNMRSKIMISFKPLKSCLILKLGHSLHYFLLIQRPKCWEPTDCLWCCLTFCRIEIQESVLTDPTWLLGFYLQLNIYFINSLTCSFIVTPLSDSAVSCAWGLLREVVNDLSPLLIVSFLWSFSLDDVIAVFFHSLKAWLQHHLFGSFMWSPFPLLHFK